MSPLTPLITPGLGGGALPPWDGPIRATTYEIKSGEFTGLTYSLNLEIDLSANYFVMVHGGTTDGNQVVDKGGCRVTADPFGTGDLGVSAGSDRIELTVASASPVDGWVGAVTVVECLRDEGTSGFVLRDVLSTALSSPGSTPQAVTDTVGSTWTDLAQVVPFGGLRGGGCTSTGSLADDWPSVAATIEVSGADTLTITRSTPVAHLEAATFTTYIVEWGSEWNVQSVTVAGTSGGDGADAVSEYDTAAITSVVRDNTWVWPTIRTTNCVGIGCSPGDVTQGAASILVTLGDGVNQNANETTVAVGQEWVTSRDAVCYVLEHSRIDVDYRFKVDGDAGAETVNVTVDTPGGLEGYDEVANPAVTTGARLVVVTSGGGGTASGERFHWGRFTWWGRHTASGTAQLSRPDLSADSVTSTAWVQSVDFSGL